MPIQTIHAIEQFPPFPERSICTYEDWRHFVAKQAMAKPEMPTASQYAVMSSKEKKAFNQTRTLFHNSFGPIEVPSMKRIIHDGLRLAMQNLAAPPGARPGIIMNGISTVGKSTIAMQLGRWYELRLTKQHAITHTSSGNQFLPVAFVNLPGEVNIMNFNFLLGRFYNIPFSKNTKEQFLTDQIKEYAADCGTSMFILDDIHFLKIKNRSHETLNNHIKHLANSISATFVYAGIGLDETGLLNEGNSKEKAEFSQTSHRFSKYDLTSFAYKEPRGKADFHSVLSFIEREFLLLHQEPGCLVREAAEYIFHRTGGYIGPLMALIRGTASLAIQNEKEHFSIDLMNRIKLDYDSEQRYKLYKKQERAATQRSVS